MSFTYRSQLNRPLTWQELDGNFSEVEQQTAQAAQSAQAAQQSADNVQGVVDTASSYSDAAAASAESAQQYAEQVSTSMDSVLRVAEGETISPVGTAAQRADKILAFDDNGAVELKNQADYVTLSPDGKISAEAIPQLSAADVVTQEGGNVQTSITNTNSSVSNLKFHQRRLLDRNARRKNFLWLAHRGFGATFPDNTLLAFSHAINAGADGIETDLSVTSDGVVRLFHGPALSERTNGTGNVTQVTSAYIDTLKMTALIGTAYESVKVAYLADLLRFIKRSGCHAYLELKNMRTIDDVDICVQQVIDGGCIENVTFGSFNWDWTLRAVNYDPRVQVAHIQGDTTDLQQRFDTMATFGGRGGMHMEFNLLLNNSTYVNYAYNNDVQLFVWTVFSSVELNKLLDIGVTRFVADHNLIAGSKFQ